MAKGSAMGLWRGKKGSSVFYKIKNSNSLQKQGIRERVYEVANPQSNNQCAQRMRLLPAQHVYGAIKEVIERSWQGVKYGEMSRQAFLKGALALGTDVPFLRKNESKAIPGAYQIAKGSLQEIVCTKEGNNYVSSIVGDFEEISVDSTIGEFTTKVLERNQNLKEGDQITFVACYVKDDNFGWSIVSIYLDSNDTTTLYEASRGIVSLDIINDGYLGINVNDGYNLAAAACIISREGTTPQRSNATLAIDKTVMSRYFSEAERILALTSYKKAQIARSTDWPVDPNDDESGTSSNIVTVTVSADPVGGGTVAGGGQKTIGDNCTVTAEPNTNFDFSRWKTPQGVTVSTQQTYTFVVASGIELVAEFMLNDEP